MDLKLAVITTKYVVKNHSLITDVFHDEDGDWQVFGLEPVSEADAMVVSLGQILKLDPSVYAVLSIPQGYQASRRTKEDKWEVRRMQPTNEEETL